MKIITDIDKMKTYARIIRKENKLVGLVPTMGYLHEVTETLVSARLTLSGRYWTRTSGSKPDENSPFGKQRCKIPCSSHPAKTLKNIPVT